MAATIDRRMLATFGALAALTPWIPLPVVDWLVENLVRRQLTRNVALAHGVTLTDADVKILADTPYGGCVGCLFAIVIWPLKKVLKYIFVFLQFKEMADVASDIVHRGLLLSEALEQGWIPGDAAQVREAIDRAVAKVELRPVERMFRGPYRKEGDWKGLVAYATQRDRARSGAGEEVEDRSQALVTTLAIQGLMPELVHAFRGEMGRNPRVETKMEGVIEPSEVLPADPKGELTAVESFEDAHEVRQLPEKKEDPVG